MKPETMGAGVGAGLGAVETGAGEVAFALLALLFFMFIASENFSK